MDFGQVISEILSAGADTATIALLVVMWRFDRRLLIIETRMLERRKKESDKLQG